MDPPALGGSSGNQIRPQDTLSGTPIGAKIYLLAQTVSNMTVGRYSCLVIPLWGLILPCNLFLSIVNDILHALHTWDFWRNA